MPTANFPGSAGVSTAPDADDIRSAYLLYADWESYTESDPATALARCRLFITAGVRLLAVLPSASSTRQRTSAEFEIAEIRKQLDHARRYTAIAGGPFAADPVTHLDFQNFRD